MNVNNATAYGVTVQPATPNAAGLVWRVESVEHVPPGENGGNHHVYCDVYDLDGREMRGNPGLSIAWDWNGRRADEPAPPAPLEKRAPEHMANIALGRGQVARVWVQGDGVPSDVVAGLHTGHPDEGGDVTEGHHSFRVRWRKVRVGAEQPPAPPQPPTWAGGQEANAAAASLTALADRLQAVVDVLREIAAYQRGQGGGQRGGQSGEALG